MTSYTLSPVWGAGAQLFDNSGNVLTGGKIYTYEAGTTTPAVTYTNPLGNVFNSNPIIANASGRLDNEIWLPVSGAYKFVLKDTNDVLIATYDNIPSIPQPPIVNDASSISYEQGYTVTAGAFTVGVNYLITNVGTTNFVAIGASANVVGVLFTATGAGSGTGTAKYSRTVQTKLQESISVLDFGAIGDGTTDDTTAIQAAATAAVGKALYFPAGTYALTGAITLLSHTHIYGDGIGISTVKAIGSNAFNLFNGINITNILFSDLSFYGNSVAVSSGDGQAIRLTMDVSATFDALDCFIDRCRFDNFKGDYWVLFYNASATYKFQNIRVADCVFQSYTGNARNGATASVPSICISISGTSSPVNSLTDIVIRNNYADCYYIKTFLALLMTL